MKLIGMQTQHALVMEESNTTGSTEIPLHSTKPTMPHPLSKNAFS
jgi:hypothetical protein